MPDGFYQYKLFVTFEDTTSRFVADPCAKYGGSDRVNENSAFVIGGNLAEARPIVRRLPVKDLVIYEMMIDDFTAELRGSRAPVDAVHDKLEYLQRLGVNAIELMPWTPWPGTEFSWGYDPRDFFAVEYRYIHDPAAPLDKLHKLRELINACHARGIHVIMDGVLNHVRAGIHPNRGFGWRGRWFKTQPGAIALMTSPGAVMVHNGQELGQDESLPGSGDGRVVPRPLRWSSDSPESGDLIGTRLYDLYAKLIRIRQDHPCLRSPNVYPGLFNEGPYGAFPGQDVAVFHRHGRAMDGRLERFIVVVNSSDFDQLVTIPISADGRWDDLLNDSFDQVSGFRLHNQRISSNWGRIYHTKG